MERPLPCSDVDLITSGTKAKVQNQRHNLVVSYRKEITHVIIASFTFLGTYSSSFSASPEKSVFTGSRVFHEFIDPRWPGVHY